MKNVPASSRFCLSTRSLASGLAIGIGIGFATKNLAVGIALSVAFALAFSMQQRKSGESKAGQ